MTYTGLMKTWSVLIAMNMSRRKNEMNIQQIDEKIKKHQEQKEKLEAEERNKSEREKVEWIKISNEFMCSVNSINGNSEYQITSKQVFNGKTYKEIQDSLQPGEGIASYELLQKLRNSGKFPNIFTEFWVFVPNPDRISKKRGKVARFSAVDYWFVLYCDGDPSIRDSALGVFLVRKIPIKANDSGALIISEDDYGGGLMVAWDKTKSQTRPEQWEDFQRGHKKFPRHTWPLRDGFNKKNELMFLEVVRKKLIEEDINGKN